MSDKTALGDRMKAHEAVTRAVLPPRTHSVVRVDGRAFHQHLKGAEKPYDHAVMDAMNLVAVSLCEGMQGAVFAFVQSDECSVLFTDFETPTTQAWFGGIVQKVVSVAASLATASFNLNYHPPTPRGPAQFDARVFTISDPVEVANYFLWRQRDCVRNSITMAAQAKFSHKQLHGMSTGDMQEMLWSEHGINWNDYPDGCKRGRVAVRKTGEREVTYTDKRTQEPNTVLAMRSWWEVEAAPHLIATPDGWLASVIPPMPSLALRNDPAQS